METTLGYKSMTVQIIDYAKVVVDFENYLIRVYEENKIVKEISFRNSFPLEQFFKIIRQMEFHYNNLAI